MPAPPPAPPDAPPGRPPPLAAGAPVPAELAATDQASAGNRGARRMHALVAQRGRWIAMAAATAALVLVTLTFTVGWADRQQPPGVPDGVPQQLAQPLQDVHDAVNGQP